MSDKIKWDAVLQSVTDTWIPLVGGTIAIIVALIVVFIIRKKKNKKM